MQPSGDKINHFNDMVIKEELRRLANIEWRHVHRIFYSLCWSIGHPDSVQGRVGLPRVDFQTRPLSTRIASWFSPDHNLFRRSDSQFETLDPTRQS